MSTLIIKSRIKNLTGKPMFVRWLGLRGTHLEADQEVVVEGSYPCRVNNKRFVANCVADIETGRIGATLITSLPTEEPTKDMLAGVASRRLGPAVGVAQRSAAETAEVKKKDERWGQGTIESQKPDPVTLPGHEDAVNMDRMQRGLDVPDDANVPKTLEIFPEGVTVTDDKAQAQQANDAASVERTPTTEVETPTTPAPAAEAPAEAPAAPEAPAAEAPAEAPAKPAAKKAAPKKRRKAAAK